MKSRFLIVVWVGLSTSGCVSTAQSKAAMGVGALGLVTGVAMSALADPQRDSGLMVAGAAIAGVGSGALWVGGASLGPNMRIDQLELSGRLLEAQQGVASVEGGTTLSEVCWTRFAELDERQQNLLLRDRRDRAESANEPYRMILSLETCPEGYERLRQASISWQVCFNPSLLPRDEACASTE
jgi:hypothetical protein